MREAWIDRWKGILILLVVLGHVVGAAGNLGTGIAGRWMNEARMIIYSFHMPAFFLLAGYCFRDAPLPSFPEFLQRRAKRLLTPYFVFGVLSIAVFAVMHGYDCWWQPFVSLLHAGAWPDGAGFKCNSVLWFLPCMFVVLLVAYGMAKSFSGMTCRCCTKLRFAMLIVFVVGAFGLSYWMTYGLHLRFLPWGLSLVPWYLGFFLVGRFLAHLGFRAMLRIKCTRFALWWLCGMILVYCWLTADNYHHVLNAYVGWQWVISVAVKIGGIGLSAYAALILPWRWLEVVGMASLGIMLVHKFAVVFLQEHLFTRVAWLTPKTESLVQATVSAALVCLISALLSYLAVWVIRRWMPWSIGEKDI